MQVIDRAFVRGLMPARDQGGHKGTFGKVYLLGGSVEYTGAPVLCAGGAVHSGCGLVFLGVPETVWPIAAARCLCAMPHPLAEQDGRLSAAAETEIRHRAAVCDAVAVGCGLGRGPGCDALVRRLLDLDRPLVLDADGINALSGHIDLLDARRGRPTVLTPHEVEFARIGGDLSRGDRERAAQDFAMAHGCVLVLKGHRTVTASPEGDVLVNTTGGSGLAKGGSGDVLTGVIASLMAQRADALRAAAVGVWLHGRAGDLAEQELTAYSVTPEDVVRKLPDAIREILE